jgi:hypothetical protein
MGPMPRIASCGVTMKYWALNVKEGQRYALLNVLKTLWMICIVKKIGIVFIFLRNCRNNFKRFAKATILDTAFILFS